MIENTKQAVGLFLEAWTPELEKSVEMFTGTTVTIEPGETAKADNLLAPGDAVLWLQQKFEGKTAGNVWIGTPESTCIAMAGAVADDPGGRESLFKELLLQSLAGAAHLLSSGLDHKIVCGNSGENGPPSDLARLQKVWLVGSNQERQPLLLGLDSDLLDLVTAEEEPAPEVEPKPRVTSTVIDQLLDLELPVAVVLGRTKLPIRDLIKLTAGSLVELDRRGGDSVDIVVHNVVVAKGEVVSIGGNYGVRIQEVISRSERIALQKSAVPPALRGPIRPVIH
jgi:flagellar motor switch protein FliN